MTGRRLVRATGVGAALLFVALLVWRPLFGGRPAEPPGNSLSYVISREPDGSIRHEFGGQVIITPPAGR